MIITYNTYSEIKFFKRNECILIILAIVLFWYLSTRNYLLFHTSIELFTTVVGFSLFLLGIGTNKICANSMFTHFSLFYGFVSIIDFLHTLTYNNFVIYSFNMNTMSQLYILGRYYESIALLFSVYFINKEISLKKMLSVNLIILIVSLSSIFIFNIFPACYITGKSYTNYKKISEILIVCFYILFIYIIKNNKNDDKTPSNMLHLLCISLIIKILSQSFFIFSSNIYDNFNVLGHICKGLSFYLMFKAIFITVIANPYNSIFKELNEKADALKKANETITKETLKYRTILDFLPLGIVKKENDKIVFVNKVFTEMFNIDANDKISTANFINSLKLNKLQISNNSKEHKSLNSHIEKEFLVDDKKLITDISTLQLSIQGVKSSTIVIKDIGDKKRADKILSKLKEKEQEEIFKAEFFTNISHELKTPINVIYTALQMEDIFLQKNDLDRIKKYNSMISQNCFRLIRIIDNLIDTSKLSSGFMQPTLVVVNIVEIIEYITQSIMSFSKYKYVNLIFDTDKEDIYIYCDLDYIERIMLNLLSNSIKYSDNGCNIKVSIHSEDTGKVLIIVEDEGIGIPDNKKQTIFNSLEKIDKSMLRKNEGSGIGLHIVKSLVELLNGTISLESTLGVGSKFFIRFPVVAMCDEICATIDDTANTQISDIIEKINIEFSDIY